MREGFARNDAIDLAAFSKRFRKRNPRRAEIERKREMPFYRGEALDKFSSDPVKQERLGAEFDRPAAVDEELLAVE